MLLPDNSGLKNFLYCGSAVIIMRVKFEKGEQRDFIKNVLFRINSPSLNDLSTRMDISYSTFKKYFCELRLLPLTLFEDMCFISKINKSGLRFNLIEETWGQSKGGKISKK